MNIHDYHANDRVTTYLITFAVVLLALIGFISILYAFITTGGLGWLMLIAIVGLAVFIAGSLQAKNKLMGNKLGFRMIFNESYWKDKQRVAAFDPNRKVWVTAKWDVYSGTWQSYVIEGK